MKKIQLSLAAIALLLGTTLAFASSNIQPGWYEPDLAGDADGKPTTMPPARCTGAEDLCATQYNASGVILDQVFEP